MLALVRLVLCRRENICCRADQATRQNACFSVPDRRNLDLHLSPWLRRFCLPEKALRPPAGKIHPRAHSQAPWQSDAYSEQHSLVAARCVRAAIPARWALLSAVVAAIAAR